MSSDIANPLEAISNMIAFNSRDFAEDRFEAWLYGIVLGWDGDDNDPYDGDGAMDEVAARFGWTAAQVANLRALHANWKRLESAAESALARPEEG